MTPNIFKHTHISRYARTPATLLVRNVFEYVLCRLQAQALEVVPTENQTKLQIVKEHLIDFSIDEVNYQSTST